MDADRPVVTSVLARGLTAKAVEDPPGAFAADAPTERLEHTTWTRLKKRLESPAG